MKRFYCKTKVQILSEWFMGQASLIPDEISTPGSWHRYFPLFVCLYWTDCIIKWTALLENTTIYSDEKRQIIIYYNTLLFPDHIAGAISACMTNKTNHHSPVRWLSFPTDIYTLVGVLILTLPTIHHMDLESWPGNIRWMTAVCAQYYHQYFARHEISTPATKSPLFENSLYDYIFASPEQLIAH